MAGPVERILILDENEANILFFQVLLKELGHEKVFTYSNAEEALLGVEQNNIQFVVTAWEQSPMPGTVFVQRIRMSRRRKRIPFLIFSKRLTESDLQLTAEVGLTNVLAMPFDRTKASLLLKDLITSESTLTPLELKLRKMEDLLEERKPTEVLRIVSPDMSKRGLHLPRFKTIIAETWMLINKLDRAEKSLKEALEADENYVPAHYAYSRLCSSMGNHDGAIAILTKVMEKSPKNFSTILNLGSAYVEANQHEKAKETLAKIQILDEDNPAAKDELGKIAIKEGDMPLAAKLLAETQNGDMLARYFNTVGIAQVAKGEFDAGIQTYDNALKILTTRAKTHLLQYNLGLAWRKKGNLEMSFKLLCQSYMTDPTFEKGYATLVRVSKELKEKGVTLDPALVKSVKDARLMKSGERAAEATPGPAVKAS